MSQVIKIDKSCKPNLDADWKTRLVEDGETKVANGLPWKEFRYTSTPDNKKHLVSIRKDQNNDVIGSCTCPHGMEKSSINPCEHVYAGMLYCEENGYGELPIERPELQTVVNETKKKGGIVVAKETPNENMRFWNAVNQPPSGSLKPINAGRLKGMTDVNPQWRYKVLTEQFGPCGDGWKFTIDDLWLEPGADDVVFAFAKINLFVKINGDWSEPIPGVGGSMLVAKETRGLHNNDEGFKMAITDALGTAAKMIGVGADIYMGMWDGTKYIDKTDDSMVMDWLAACEEAASNQSLEEYREWWKNNEESIKNDCDEVGASRIYKAYASLGRKMAG